MKKKKKKTKIDDNYIFISCKKKFGIKNLKNKIYSLCKKTYYKKNNNIVNIKKIIKEIKIIYKIIKKYLDSKIFLDELLNSLIFFNKKICKFFNQEKKSVMKNIFKNFCVGK